MSRISIPEPRIPRPRSDKGESSTTELVFILDRSGSMGGLESDVIGGFNDMIARQKELPGAVRVTTVLFDHAVETLHDRTPLERVAPLTARDYTVRGCTALLDAIGSTVRRINKRQKADPSGRPDHTIVVITTDGLENASTRFSLDEVRALVEKRTKKNGWEFLFMGANMDAIATAAGLGIGAARAATYVNDAQGTAAVYAAACDAVAQMRMGSSLDAGWKSAIEKDTAARGWADTEGRAPNPRPEGYRRARVGAA